MAAFQQFTTGSREVAREGLTILHTSAVKSIYHFQVAARSTIQDILTALHARLHGKFIEIQRERITARFIGASFRNRDNFPK